VSSTPDNTGSDDDQTDSREYDGRSIQIDTGYYEVHVWGDPDDSLGVLLDVANDAADRAMEDLEHIDNQTESDDAPYR